MRSLLWKLRSLIVVRSCRAGNIYWGCGQARAWTAELTILGHSSITMTFDVYGHLFDNAGDDVDLFAKLEAALDAA